MARALKPGGLFLLDIINGDFLENNFTARDWHDQGDHYLLEERTDDRDGVFNTWTRIPKKGGKILKKAFFTRKYGKKSISAALGKAGLKPLKFWGGFQGKPLTSKSIRLIVLASKGR